MVSIFCHFSETFDLITEIQLYFVLKVGKQRLIIILLFQNFHEWMMKNG